LRLFLLKKKLNFWVLSYVFNTFDIT
jgi:hypothetical protein